MSKLNTRIFSDVQWRSKLFYLHLVLLHFLLMNCSLMDSACQSQTEGATKTLLTNVKEETPESIKENTECIWVDGLCLWPSEIAAYNAIKDLHSHLDDDQSGDIDLSESVDFLKEELNYTKGFEKRQRNFHHNDDQHISVQELWRIWLQNDVHNWTVEQTVAWLSASVELGQYGELFYENAINGSMLPRLATNSDPFLIKILGIKNATHRSKITIKAMDIVLFGPPKDSGSLVKDLFIASLLALLILLLFKFVSMSKHNSDVIKKMDQEMELLQCELTKFLTDKQFESEFKETSPTQSEKNFIGSQDDFIKLGDSASNSPNDFMDESIHLDSSGRQNLHLWLQLTYERERKALQLKLKSMEQRISGAKESCEKLRVNKKNLFGAMSFIHGKLETKGLPIIEARAAFEEIQQMDREMKVRWGEIEMILNFDVASNAGLDRLEFLLEPKLKVPSTTSPVGYSGTASDVDSQTSTIRSSIRSSGVEPQRRKTTRSDVSLRKEALIQSHSGLSLTLVSSDSVKKSASYESSSRDEGVAPLLNGHERSATPSSSCSFTVGQSAIVIGDSTPATNSSLRVTKEEKTLNKSSSEPSFDKTDDDCSPLRPSPFVRNLTVHSSLRSDTSFMKSDKGSVKSDKGSVKSDKRSTRSDKGSPTPEKKKSIFKSKHPFLQSIFPKKKK